MALKIALNTSMFSLHKKKKYMFRLVIRRRFSSSIPTQPWKWVPPPARPVLSLEEESLGEKLESLPRQNIIKEIDVIPKVHLSKEEAEQLLLLNGAEDVVSKSCGNLADAMVIATGRGDAHAKMLAKSIVLATKARRLKVFNPKQPIEGEEAWYVVDTGRLIVHLFESIQKRRQVGLEDHLDDLTKASDDARRRLGKTTIESEDILEDIQKYQQFNYDSRSDDNLEEELSLGSVTDSKSTVKVYRKPNTSKENVLKKVHCKWLMCRVMIRMIQKKINISILAEEEGDENFFK